MNFRMGIMTDFSIGQSLLTIDRTIESAKKQGIEKIVVADDMTISALIALQKASFAAGIKAMIGTKFRVYDDPTYRKIVGYKPKPMKYFAVKVFPKSEHGLQSIFKILTKANTEERFYYNARGAIEDLTELEDCIVTSGDFFGLNGDETKRVLDYLNPSCSFYTEVVPVNTPLWDRVNMERLCVRDPRIKGCVQSYPALYQTTDEADSLPILKAVCTNTQVKSGFLPKQWVSDFALERDSGDLHAMFDRLQKRYPGAAIDWEQVETATDAVAFNDEPFYEFAKHAPCLPKMAEDEFATLVDMCKRGWAERLFRERMGYKPSPESLPVYKNRLAYELSVIKKMGFAGYFLVVADLVNWSKTNGVRVGPGRGSGGGSLIAYLMGITEVDPIRFNLIFERFINPSRVDLPDIDLDYQSSKRPFVIEYLRKRYGDDRVAGITNYGTLASASALRDTGRVFGLTPLALSATKLVPKESGIPVTLAEAADMVPEIDKLKADYPEVWKHALRFEGVMRSLGQHAAGTVVAGEPLVKRAVVEKRAEGNVVNWDKRVVEDYGLIKMDILGLSTLDVLDIAKDYIKKRHGIDLDYLSIPLDLSDVLDAFGRGDTTAVFQFDSKGMQDLLRRLARGGALTFDDITAATALYRPGPLDSGLTEDYVAIKQGLKAPRYEHPVMKKALASTYGVMVYQEQIMQVSQDLCGFTMTEADHLRRATAKKDLKHMIEMKDKFIEGAQKTVGMSEMVARNLWAKIEKFAAYSFNKSHSCAYSILSYWSAFLKVRYPAEYFAAQLSIVKEDKYTNLVKDARKCGIDVIPPDVNISTDKFEIKDDKTIVMPFSAIKGCSATIANKIVKARSKVGQFVTKEQFIDMARTRRSGINVRVVGNLDLVGAFANIDPTQKPATDESRIKDQVVLMPGLVVNTVKSNAVTIMDQQKKLDILSLHEAVVSCKKCDLCTKVHPFPVVGGSKCRFMVVFDNPSLEEEEKGKMMVGKGAQYLKTALKNAGVSAAQGYYTSLVKAKKNDKYLTNAQLNACPEHLEKELEAVKPGAILCMGSASVKRFLGNMKVSAGQIGEGFYVPKYDATIIVGLNPLQCFFDPKKLTALDAVAQKLAEVLAVCPES